MSKIWSSLQFKIPTVFIVSFLFILIAIFLVFSTVGKNQLERQAYKQVILSGQNIVSELGNRIATAESLAISLAKLGENLPRDVNQSRVFIKNQLDIEGSEAFIAGGGVWPAPYKFDPKIERRSFFWGRDKQGVMQYYDNYNNPDGPGYHHEEWYVPAKHLERGKVFWSKSYMDPYSYQPMVTVTVPMYKNDEFYGVSTVDLKLEGLKAFLEKIADTFDGYAFAVDRNGKFLSFPDEEKTKIFDLDNQGGRTEEFITVGMLSQKLPAFKPLANVVQNTISNVISKTKQLNIFKTDLASLIAQDSYQIDLDEANLIAAVLADTQHVNVKPELSYHELFIKNDMLLGESAYAAVFDMPQTYWKIVTVMPYSKAIEASNVIYNNLISSIVMVMLVSLVLMLFVVRRILVKPISDMSKQLQALTEAEGGIQSKLETNDKGELGMLAHSFNRRSDKLLEVQNELQRAHEELEQRVIERTEELHLEIEKRKAEQAIKEERALRVETQHSAIIDLSLHKSLFHGDSHESARIINQIASNVLKIARASIWLLDEAGEYLEVVDLYDRQSASHSGDLRLKVTEYPVYFNALRNGRSIAVEDIYNDARTVDLHEYAHASGIKSMLDSPIRVAGKFRGVVCFEDVSDNRQWQTDEIRFSGEIADQFQHVLTNADRIKTDDKIRQLAFYDPLTNLANRRLLQETIKHELEVAKRSNVFGSLLYLDLDNFKTLNDSLGHSIGDELLVQLSKRLRKTLRKKDTAARLGGDEFVVLLTGENKNKNQAMDQALSVARKVQSAIGETYRLQGYEHIITASIGIAIYPDDHTEAADMLRQADSAMYKAKDDGRNTISFFNPELQKAADNRLLIEKELRRAIAQQEFKMYYQPQVDEYGNLVGTEALIRWMHPEKGMVLPGEFIPIAEETGLILELGAWILKDVCKCSKVCHINDIAINISPRQFRQVDFVHTVEQIIETMDVDASKLIFEVTEGIVIENIEDTINKMKALKEMGIRFAIDDFGTGYSSLAYLKQLPLDQLKINDKFVRDINVDPSDAIIVETIILMATHLGLNVVAEGVETDEQLDFLVEKGCHIFQGYYFSYPLEKNDFSVYMSKEPLVQPVEV